MFPTTITITNDKDLQLYEFEQAGILSLMAMIARRTSVNLGIMIYHQEDRFSIAVATQPRVLVRNKDDFKQLEDSLVRIFNKYYLQEQEDFLRNSGEDHIYHDFITLHAMLFEDTINLLEIERQPKGRKI